MIYVRIEFKSDFRKGCLNLIFNNVNYYSEYNCVNIFILDR